MLRNERTHDESSRLAAVNTNKRLPVSTRDLRAAKASSITLRAYELAAATLNGRAINVCDLGCGTGEGALVLAGAQLHVTGVDRSAECVTAARRLAPGVQFEEGRIEHGDALPHDALVLIDSIGFVADDAALLRGLARRVQSGTTLIGAVRLAAVGQRLEAPARRAYSREGLDALLVRAGWAPPTQVGHVDGFLVFESHRMESSPAHAAIELVETLDPRNAAETVLLRLAGAARSNTDASLARELLLSMAALQLHRGDLDAADEAATAANAIAPSSARPLVVLGRIARARGAVDDAEALFDHALAADECNVDAWVEWSGCLEAQGNLDAAVETLACAASLEPADHAIAANEARMLGTAGQGKAAIRVLDRVLAYGGGVSAPLRTAMTWATATGMQRGGATKRPITGVFSVPSQPSADRDRIAS